MKKVIGTQRGSDLHWVGDGFPVHTVFSYHRQARELSPFLLLDHAGPADFPPSGEPRGVDWHPHRGFETVTVVFEGAVDHEDSAGNAGSIGPGDVQWMTAGSGVFHKEFHGREFSRTGGRFHVLQLWVNLPAKHKMAAPAYQTILDRDIPVVSLPNDAGQVRVIAGEFAGERGPARTVTPMQVLDLRLTAGGGAELPLREGWTASLFVVEGRVTVNGTAAEAGQLVILDRHGADADVRADADAIVLLLHGEPIDEPVAGYGPFVMNTAEEIRQAVEDTRAGRMGRALEPATH